MPAGCVLSGEFHDSPQGLRGALQAKGQLLAAGLDRRVEIAPKGLDEAMMDRK